MWVLLFAFFLPYETTVCDSVTVLEINHLYRENGKLSFRQLILWDEYPKIASGLHVVDWRYMDRHSQWPIKNVNGIWVSQWYDSQIKSLRRVTGVFSKITHTYYDPELRDRRLFPQYYRRGLSE